MIKKIREFFAKKELVKIDSYDEKINKAIDSGIHDFRVLNSLGDEVCIIYNNGYGEVMEIAMPYLKCETKLRLISEINYFIHKQATKAYNPKMFY